MQVNREDVTKQLYRAYNARGLVTTSGAANLSPVLTVGAGAHPSLATQQMGVMTSLITAVGAFTGGIGLIVPKGAGVLAVVTDLFVIGSGAAAATYEVLLDGPNADVDYPPTQFPTNANTQNQAQVTSPFFWGFITTGTTPNFGNQIGIIGLPAASSGRIIAPPIVLMPGWGIVVRCNTNTLIWGSDIRFEAFELSPT